ncbi:MAG: hypothetical protein A2V57_04065 [Candidatus Aminicenantes bacterium RBG_19FT_COMBO_65_30]|nr:MAG: hypothetical protein A2V57_04065 [Candidatus Aminicenantes bacterium RBG_19FT_COMBO_65_30]
MKKTAVLAFAVVFAVCMFHYFYAEDHCPVHCPSKGGQLGHVHHHHAAASTCLCFWSSLLGPEADEFAGATDFQLMTEQAGAIRPRGPLAADIAHPPKSSPA